MESYSWFLSREKTTEFHETSDDMVAEFSMESSSSQKGVMLVEKAKKKAALSNSFRLSCLHLSKQVHGHVFKSGVQFNHILLLKIHFWICIDDGHNVVSQMHYKFSSDATGCNILVINKERFCSLPLVFKVSSDGYFFPLWLMGQIVTFW
ncbi:hypothetical protein L1987_73222 [Smallanthus sonchifolius]|uniref:Uncharacterized protein n=1 Tax=Smallanthus sonchifolius TaxID=185202 RepID=A0ACB9A0A7_9ASTR|nr:hypothetical protein L1987_73222 [Smallanthus sonchifolius]